MKQAFAALICGYGVPKDIFSDPNYAAYLHPAVNYLFSRYRNAPGTIVVNGGATDMYKPYRRTEAGEMKRWLAAKKFDWKIVARPKSLTTVENLLNFAIMLKAWSEDSACDAIIFCEATRAARIRRLMREIPALRRAKVVAIDFDASPRRYDLDAIRRNERDFLAFELWAIRDKTGLKSLRKFARNKLHLMRQYSPEEAHRHLQEILKHLHDEYRKTAP